MLRYGASASRMRPDRQERHGGGMSPVSLSLIALLVTGGSAVSLAPSCCPLPSEPRLCTVADANNSQLSFLQGKHIAVGDLALAPYLFVDDTQSGNARYTGYDVDLLQSVADELGFTYTIYEITKPENATYDDVLYTAAQRYDVIMKPVCSV